MNTLTIYRGDSAEWEFAVLKADGTVQDITGATLRWMAKARVDDLDAAAKIIATTANAKCVLTTPLAGLCEVRLVPSDTDTLALGTYLWDLQIRDSTSKVW